MPGLRGTPAVTMQTSAPSIALVGVGARHLGVEALDRRRLHEVERLALRHAFGDVEKHDVAELFEPDEMSQGAADLACADQGNLLTRHVGEILRERAIGTSCGTEECRPNGPAARWLNRTAQSFKARGSRPQSQFA